MIIYLQMLSEEADKAKFADLYEKYRTLMFVAAFNVLKNEDDAEDAIHHAFLSIIKNWDKINTIDPSKIRSYLVITAERKALDIIRATTKYPCQYDENISGVDFAMPANSSDLAEALRKLPAKYRQVLLLRYDYGCEIKELMRFYRMNDTGVYKLISRAKQELEKLLEEGCDV